MDYTSLCDEADDLGSNQRLWKRQLCLGMQLLKNQVQTSWNALKRGAVSPGCSRSCFIRQMLLHTSLWTGFVVCHLLYLTVAWTGTTYVFWRPIFQPRDWALPLARRGGYVTEDKINATNGVNELPIDNKMVIPYLWYRHVESQRSIFHPQSITGGYNDPIIWCNMPTSQATISKSFDIE